MPDLGWTQLLCATQGEIIILRTFKPFAKTADLAHNCMPVNSEMTDAILSKKEFRIPIGFKVWAATLPTLIDLIFVGVNQPCVGMGINSSGD